jgi:hypothetical protein
MAAVSQHASATATLQGTTLTNGHTDPLDSVRPSTPAAPTNKKVKGKKDKYGPDEMSKALAAKISQLEQDAAGEKDQEAEIGVCPRLNHGGRKESYFTDCSFPPTEREVKKATRDLNQLLLNVEPLNRIETLQRKYSELLADMKKLERDHAKNKKRADLLQKESDKAKSENNKTNTLKEKLEKLCRELTKDNKKMKVRTRICCKFPTSSG